MDIRLRANQYHVWLGMPFNSSELSSAKFVKPGFFMSVALPDIKKSGDTVYWTKNPIIDCFDDATSVIPNMPHARNADLICGTSVFLYFNGARLRLIVAQVIMSFVWAQTFTNEFRRAALKILGDPSREDLANVPTHKGRSIQNQVHLTCTWRDGSEFLISKLSAAGNNAYLMWGRD